MSTSDQRFASPYATLPTQQRRIRHLRSVAARNIQNDGDLEIIDLKLYFSLHSSDKNKAFYTSEVIKGSVNPTWRTFNLDHLALEDTNTSKTSLVVRVWRHSDGGHRLMLEWTVSLSGLVYFGEKLQREVVFSPNTLVFGMFGGFYVAPKQKSEPHVGVENDCVLTVEQCLVRKSYSVMATDRIQTILRAIKQTEMSGRNVRKRIEEALSDTKYTQQRKATREAVAMRVAMLRNELDWRTDRLRFEKDKYERLQSDNIYRDRKVQGKFDTLRKDRSRLREKKKSYFDVREELIKTGAQLVMRRKQLISELTLIYPIHESPHEEYSILGVVLPNAERLHGLSETQLEVALGYTTHLVQMISHFLDIPVRYPTQHRGSKSTIHDHILDKLQDREREFPLYSRGKEKFQCDYGVYLLNKNIAQIRYYCGLGTTDLRVTLANLKTLLQLRLGVKFDHMEVLRQAQLQSTRFPVTSQPHAAASSREKFPQGQLQKLDRLKRNAQEREIAQSNQSQEFFEIEGSLDSALTSQDLTDSHIPKTFGSRLDNNSDIFKSSPDSFFEVKFSDSPETGQDALSIDVSRTDPTSDIPHEHADNSPFQNSLSRQGVASSLGSNALRHVDYDYDVNSVSSESNNHRHQSAQNRIAPLTALDPSLIATEPPLTTTEQSLTATEQTLTTLEQLTKEKLLGPIANYEDIDVSSSEDSASAVYGQQFKFLREQTTFQSLMSDNLVIEEDSSSISNDTGSSLKNKEPHGVSLTEDLTLNGNSKMDKNSENGCKTQVGAKIESSSGIAESSCKTPDSSAPCVGFDSYASRQSSAPIDVTHSSYLRQQSSDDSYIDSSPTFNLQSAKAS